MELTDYDILGVTPNATFRIIKNAYYDLARIYHPDSLQIIRCMSKNDREIAFKKIKNAYENIKQKMNIIEVDLPKEDIKYTVEHIIKKNNKIEVNCKNFTKKFNKEFEDINKIENIDNPFSIYYEIPEETKKNVQDGNIILVKEWSNDKSNDIYEFGINFVEDHSTDKYYDFKKLHCKENNFLKDNLNFKEKVDINLNQKLEKLINKRNENIKITDEEIQLINKQIEIKRDIEKSKIKIEKERNKKLLE